MKRFDNPPREEWTAICQRPAIDVSSLQQMVAAVFSNVAAHGDTALKDYTAQFDGVDLNDLRVAPEALSAAAAQVPENCNKPFNKPTIISKHSTGRSKPPKLLLLRKKGSSAGRKNTLLKR